jgi:aminoglycoside phosphotransferase
MSQIMSPLLALPDDLRALFADAVWTADDIGCSEARIWRITRADGRAYYLKHTTAAGRADLAREHALLAWGQGKLPAPAIAYWRDDGQRADLVTMALPGVMTCDPSLSADVAVVIARLAEGLRLIHALPIADCPFDQRLDRKLAEARRRIDAGLIDVEDFDRECRGADPEDLYQRLLAERPATEDLVFTHGDYCLPNIFIDPQDHRLTGFIDWGRGGVADRCQDLGIAARSIARNWGTEWVPAFFARYGIVPDAAKIAYYRLLDELF